MSMNSSSRPADDELDRLVALGITRQQVESGDDCLDPEVLASYADGGLSVGERAEADAHLARCRDCRRALALQIESDPVVTSSLAAAASAASRSAAVTSAAPDSAATETGSRATSNWPRIVKSANIWLPLAAALVVATGLWVAFSRSRQEAPYLASAPAQLSARNESSAAKQSAAAQRKEEEIARLRKPSDDRAQPRGADSDARPREAPPGRADAPAVQAPASARAREALREEFAAARPNAEADRRIRRDAVAPAPAPPPPPLAAALADAAPARASAGGAAGQEAQAKVAGQLAPSAPPPATAPQAPASAPVQTNAANQNVAQQQVAINQQTGPMANLNTAPSPAPKTDERRQAADASKVDANEKAIGGVSGTKSADTKYAKAEEAEPKSLARAKAAPESAAAGTAPVDAASTKSASAASGKPAAGARPAGSPATGNEAEATSRKGGNAESGSGARPTFRAESDTAAAGGVAGGTAAASPGASPGATAGTDRSAAAGRGAGDTSAREINEAVTVITSAKARMLELRSADGAHWWRILAPGTIEGSTDRGATWTAEYSEPSVHLVTGAVTAKGGCWMVGRNGLVLRTRPNGGWERVTQPTTRNLVTLTATDHLIATVTDDQRRTYRTTDGGATWR
jgi:hypothetical protein